MRWPVLVSCVLIVISGQKIDSVTETLPTGLHDGLTERIGNFSIELLYHTSKSQPKGKNLILSPITVWTVLAVISEGSTGNTAKQINTALRITTKGRAATRTGFQNIYEWLEVNTTTIEIAKVNAAFVRNDGLLLPDFKDLAETVYKTNIMPLDFNDGEKTAKTINEKISKATRGRIPKLVEGNDFSDTKMILTSALYFKGQWTIPFNASSTTKMPFYNTNSTKIGEVNMMYGRSTYPFALIKELQARVIELPYGKENRLSMLIMLPNPGVSLENMFFNFAKVPLDTVFSELRLAKEEFGDDEVDCFIPRFKIESSLDMTEILSKSLGIVDLFNERALLPYIARTPLYVSKVVHKAEIEVTEEGTTASAVTAAEFSNRIGVVQFVANRAFCFMIVEKVTNSIVFGGVYETPSLY